MPKTILTLETHKQRKKESIEYVCFITKCSKILQINQYLSKNDQILKLCDFLIQLFPKTFDLYVTIYNYFASFKFIWCVILCLMVLPFLSHPLHACTGCRFAQLALLQTPKRMHSSIEHHQAVDL